MASDERIRLLYVACTRARDHLVVSLHRTQRPASSTARPTNAELLVHGMGPRLAEVPDAVDSSAPRTGERPTSRAEVSPPPPYEAWAAEREAVLRAAALPTTVAATALTEEGSPDRGLEPAAVARGRPRATGSPALDAGLQKRPRDLDLPPWLKGRYGTAVGRAVHGVLQTIDLASGAGLDAAVAAQCEAEAVPQQDRTVARLVRDALGAPSVRRAATSPHWREVYACTPVDGGRLLEGYIDLLYRGPGGLAIIDYKTAATADPAELDRRTDGYAFQGASYALAIGAATGETVTGVTLVFLTPEGAVERTLADLGARMEEVAAVVRAGSEVVTD